MSIEHPIIAYLKFLDLLEAKWYPIIIIMSSRRMYFLSFLGAVEFEKPFLDPTSGLKVASYSIGEIRGMVKVVQNWFTGIPNHIRGSR